MTQPEPKYEYRIRWRRGPAYQGWKRRYFQTLSAARNLARYLTRPNATIYTYDEEPGIDRGYELSPILALEIDRREVMPWEPLEGTENLLP